MKKSNLAIHELLKLNSSEFLDHVSEHYITETEAFGYILKFQEDIASLEEFIKLIDDHFITFNLIWGGMDDFKIGEIMLYRIKNLATQKLDEISKKNPQRKENKEFTTTRQILAIQTLLDEYVKIDRTIDKTVLTAFIQFITGKEPNTAPKDTNIYKYVTGQNTRSDKLHNQDCDFVAGMFDKIGLQNTATKIRNGKTEK
ncbi:hypothetical protein [Dysgonomonas macrotermitis]|uniref:Uncharacterized protein n=1 Tax=Dysgonomonas macrotermitis TaxID=1346286 RepID=A0A1M5GMG5_9BACT|nr:hypothetical protein [Dysgonomonas macrotermitis]SHG04935.1 hypothetical protein SAMN05444362_11465 [Dysgonomonas macrotermitis]